MTADYCNVLADAAHVSPDAIALLHEDDHWTYRQVADAADRVAASLASAGIASGDRVAMCIGNDPSWVITFFALARLRASAVMLSTAWKQLEIAHALKLTQPKAVVAASASVPPIDEAGRPALAFVVGEPHGVGWQSFEKLLAGSAASAPNRIDDASDFELALPFSSGTTGLPKAVRHTHRTLLSATRQWQQVLGISSTDRLQAVTPLAHILGIVNVGAAFLGCATIRLFPKFNAIEMLRSIERDRMTIGITVAPIAVALASMPDLENYGLDSLRYLNWSATPVNADIARRITARTGIPWQPAYGTTEVPILTSNPVAILDQTRLDSVGKAALGVEIETRDVVTGEILPRTEPGELVVRSPAAMIGYLPEQPQPPFTAEGWYRTGDLGTVDAEGWVVVTGRLKELIKVSGYQVSPVEIEVALARSADVQDCAVFGAPDDRRGEAPWAAVVRAPGSERTSDDLIGWLTPQLASYKQLRGVVFVNEIPRTPSGKVLRQLLAASVRA